MNILIYIKNVIIEIINFIKKLYNFNIFDVNKSLNRDQQFKFDKIFTF